jgi:hypothetical protein
MQYYYGNLQKTQENFKRKKTDYWVYNSEITKVAFGVLVTCMCMCVHILHTDFYLTLHDGIFLCG